MECRVGLRPDDPYKPLTYVFIGFLIQVLAGFQWNVLRTLPTASLWLNLVCSGLR